MPDSNTRYTAAWGEISARIQSRERVLLSFIAITAVLVGLSLSKDEMSLSAIAVGYLALATALLNRHHDLVINSLARFQKALVTKDTQNIELPDWHTGEYIGRALLARRTRDFAQIMFILFGSTPSLYIASKGLSSPTDVKTLLWYASIACSVVAIYVVWLTRRQRIKEIAMD